MKKQKRKVNIILAIISAAVITAAVFACLYYNGVFLIRKDKCIENENLTAVLHNRRLALYDEKGNAIWSLPSKIKCQDFYIEDLDNDGAEELLVLCWKIGRYGKHKPFFVKHDEIKWSQHIYIYTIADDKVIQKWMASDIGMEASCISVDDSIVHIVDINGKETDWVWKSFGLQILE